MTNKKKSKRKRASTMTEKNDDKAPPPPPVITYYHDTFHRLLLLLDECVTHMRHDDTSKDPPGVSEWLTWTEAGLLKPNNTLLTILNALGITKDHKSIKGAFHHILQRVPSLADYIVSSETLSDDSITVSVYDEPKRRSARLQQPSSVLEPVGGEPPNADAVSTDLQSFVADMDQDLTDHLTAFQEYDKSLAQSNALLQALKEEHDTLKVEISTLQESFTSVKNEFKELKVEHETLIQHTNKQHAEFKKVIKGSIDEIHNERVKCEQQLRAVGDTTVLEMSTWSADFSRKCQSTLDKVQDKLNALLSEYDGSVKPYEDPRIHKYIPIDNTSPPEYSCLRNGVLDKDTYYFVNGLHIKVKDHNDSKSPSSTSSPTKRYAPSENIDSQRESNGRASMFGNTYFLGKPNGKFSNMDAYEFPSGRFNILDVKYFTKADTNTMTEISSKASIISHYKQYVAAAGRFGILITPPHEVTRWG